MNITGGANVRMENINIRLPLQFAITQSTSRKLIMNSTELLIALLS